MFTGKFSIVIALRWVKKPLRWTKKTVSFIMIPCWCQLKSNATSYSVPEELIQVFMLLKHDVSRNVSDSNCVEMGVEAIEMD